jgi:type IV pilus assembly protein PilM
VTGVQTCALPISQQVVEVAARGLADEISTTLEFFRDSATPDAEVADRVGAAVGRVLLTGSGAELGGFAELLAGRLGVPVERLDVLGHVRAPGRLQLAEVDVPALAVPAGLWAGATR